MNSDFIYYIVPNFCGFPCANYFAFNERTFGYFALDRAQKKKYMAISKKFIIVSNPENEAFLEAVRQQSEQPQMLYLKTGQFEKKSIDGDFDSEDAQNTLMRFLDL